MQRSARRWGALTISLNEGLRVALGTNFTGAANTIYGILLILRLDRMVGSQIRHHGKSIARVHHNNGGGRSVEKVLLRCQSPARRALALRY
jgi:hypothetical protein